MEFPNRRLRFALALGLLGFAGIGCSAQKAPPATNEAQVPPPAMCGNGAAEEGEQCDDGNDIDDDCCSNECRFQLGSGECRPVDYAFIPADGTTVRSRETLGTDSAYAIRIAGTYRYDRFEAGEFADAQYREDDSDQFTIQF